MCLQDFKPSKYQEKIYDFIQHGVGNAVINAKAGSGKTTTAVNSLKLIDDKKKVLYIAFNKAIVTELNKKLSGTDNTKVSTFHSLGLSIIKENYGYNTKLSEYKYMSYIMQNSMYLSDFYSDFNNDMKELTFRNNVMNLVNFSRFNTSESIKEINKIADKYGIVPIADEIEVSKKVMEWGAEHTEEIDYTDMIWIPYVNNLSTKKYKYNWIFIDEAQDTSIVEQKLIKKCLKRGGRFVAIGDEYQCINAFAGSNPEAFKAFLNEPNTTELKLPISYRCPKKVIDLARRYVPDIEYAENAEEGAVLYDVSKFSPKSGDMILCRNMAPLVELYMDYLKLNKKCYMKGEGFVTSLKGIVKPIRKEELSLNLTYDGIFPRLYGKLFDTVISVAKKEKISEDEAFKSKVVMGLYDNIKALEAISEGLRTKEELINKIDDVFGNNNEEGVCFSTIHKAKGLEADNVYILNKSLIPSVFAQKDWEIEAEHNLIYVSITRAKKTLSYIEEEENINWGGKKNAEDMIDGLKKIRERVSKVLNKDYKYIDALMDKGKELSKVTNNLGKCNDIGKKSKTVNKKIGGNKLSKFIK